MRRAAALAFLLGGCTHAGILELEVELPAASGDVRYAVVDARSLGTSFEDEGEVASFPLGAPAALSVVAGAEAQELPLEIRVRFCASAECEAEPAPPEVRVVIERAFYSGAHTFVNLRIDAVPSGSLVLPQIDACEVRGCTPSTGASYCLADGTHICEQ